MLHIRTQEQFFPLLDYIKQHLVLHISFLNITERMEVLRQSHTPLRTLRPPEISSRKQDLDWHQPRDVAARPPPAPVGALYNGFAVHMEGERLVYLVYNNERHEFQSDVSMLNMGFDYECVLMFRKNRMHPVPHRIMDNIPIGKDIPLEGVYVKISPTYELRPLRKWGAWANAVSTKEAEAKMAKQLALHKRNSESGKILSRATKLPARTARINGK